MRLEYQEVGMPHCNLPVRNLFRKIYCCFRINLEFPLVLRHDFRDEPQNSRVTQGDTALLECSAPRGTPEPTVLWRKNGQTIDANSTKRIRLVDGSNLAIQDVRQADEGRYQCVAKNIVGIRESQVAYLKINGNQSS